LEDKKIHKEEKKNKPKKSPRLTDWFQFIIALIIILSFTLFVILSYPQFLDGDDKLSDKNYEIITLIAPFLGTIIGFYFGQKPVRDLTTQVSDITSTNKETTKTLRNGEKLLAADEKLISTMKNFIDPDDKFEAEESSTDKTNPKEKLKQDMVKLMKERKILKDSFENRLEFLD